jgi:DNA polymerase III delta prime subunit
MYQEHARVVFTEAPDQFSVDTEDTVEGTIVRSEIIGIDEIRELSAEAHRRPREGFTEKHIYLIGLKITSEAQQAALKILEEPPVGVTITLVLPSGTPLFDTVLSRVIVSQLDEASKDEVLTDWLSLSVAERLIEIEQRIKKQDTVWMNSIKSALQKHVSSSTSMSGEILKEVDFALSHLLTRGASNKMLFEHIALALPLTR